MDNAKFNKKGKYVGRTTTGLVADKNFKAMGIGERTSRTSSLITKADGTRFRRKNANQYGDAEGGNDYTETRPDRSDKFKKGSTIKSGKKKAVKKVKEPKIVRSYFEEESYEYGKGGNAGKTCCYSIGGL